MIKHYDPTSVVLKHYYQFFQTQITGNLILSF